MLSLVTFTELVLPLFVPAFSLLVVLVVPFDGQASDTCANILEPDH